MSTWEERMGARSRTRRQVHEFYLARGRAMAHQAFTQTMLARMGPRPTDCDRCWRAGPQPAMSYPWAWHHTWPDAQGFVNWDCGCECHGPHGHTVWAIAYA